jgi:hypothetical protein
MNQATAIGVVVLMLFGGLWLTQEALNSHTEAAKKIQEPSSTSNPVSQVPQAYAGWRPEEIKAHKDTLRKLGEQVRQQAVRNFINPQPSPIPQVPSIPNIPGVWP